MQAIVSVTDDWGIGWQGKLLVKNANDMLFFRNMTLDKTVISGETTFRSFANTFLWRRHHIVLTNDRDFTPHDADVDVAHSIDEVLDMVSDTDPDDVWLIGGASLYEQMLDMCDVAYVTVNHVTPPADAFFPDIDARPNWSHTGTVAKDVTGDGIAYEIRRYENDIPHRRHPRP